MSAEDSGVPFTKKIISDMTSDEYRYLTTHLDDMRTSYAETGNKLSGEANSTERALCGQLILINTVVITASIFALSGQIRLTDAQSLIIFLIFTLQIISVSAGVKHFFDIEKFYGGAAEESRNIVNLINSSDYSTLDELSTKSETLVTTNFRMTKRLALTVQVVTLLLSLVCFWVLITAILFDFHLLEKTLNVFS